MDLGSEPAYQQWCVQMAEFRTAWRGVFVERLINSFDRRIPAVLNDIDVTVNGEVDIMRELYFTAGYWHALESRLAEWHARPK